LPKQDIAACMCLPKLRLPASRRSPGGIQQAAASRALLPRTSQHPLPITGNRGPGKEVNNKYVYSTVSVRRNINAMRLTRQVPPCVHLPSQSFPKGLTTRWSEHVLWMHPRIPVLQRSENDLWTSRLPPIRAMETHPTQVTKQCVKNRVAFVLGARPLMSRAFSSIPGKNT